MKRAFLVLAALLSLLGQTAMSQHFVKMNDTRFIELAVDMIRKGVQQEDTAKLLMVLAPEVSIRGDRVSQRSDLAAEVEAMFAISFRRPQAIEKAPSVRYDSPLRESGFWDFDILEPRITIDGDTAVVNCRLVLWAAPTADRADKTGDQVSERFVFAVCRKQRDDIDSGGSGVWPAPLWGRPASAPRSWALVGCDSLFGFLEKSLKSDNSPVQGKEGK